MADQRIINYLRQNMGNYPLETLKAACTKNGFSPAAVEEAAQTVLAQSAPPPPPAIGPGDSASPPADANGAQDETFDYIDFSPKNLFANAVSMTRQPEQFFSRIDPNTGFGAPLATVVVWALICAPISVIAVYAKAGSVMVAVMSLLGSLFAFPIVAAVMSFVGAGIFHALCAFMGGTSTFSAGYGAIAAMCALMPIGALLGVVPLAGAVVPQLGGLYLSVQAAVGLHKVAKPKAWLVFGALTLFWLFLSISAAVAARRLRKSLNNFQVQTMTQTSQSFSGGQMPAGSPMPAMDPRQAVQAASSMMQALGDEETSQDFQRKVNQAMNDPMAVIQKLQYYQNMEYPPKETLLLLDSRSSGLLVKEWPKISGPIRQSLVETLPTIPKAERSGSVKEMIEATRGVNDMLGESMKMMNQVMQQHQRQPPSDERR